MDTGNKRVELITVDEAERHYLISKGTWRYYIHLRRLPSYKIGRRRFLSRADIEAFIERHRQEAIQ